MEDPLFEIIMYLSNIMLDIIKLDLYKFIGYNRIILNPSKSTLIFTSPFVQKKNLKTLTCIVHLLILLYFRASGDFFACHKHNFISNTQNFGHLFKIQPVLSHKVFD